MSRLLKTKIPPPVVTLLFALLALSLSRFTPVLQMDFLGRQGVVLLLSILGVSLNLSAFVQFLRVGTTVNPLQPNKANRLVVAGFYRYSRNPMYLGMFFILASVVLWSSSISAILACPLFIVYMNYAQIIPEEEAMEVLFASDYLDYKKNVRRWL